jgi:hypothetical protein
VRAWLDGSGALAPLFQSQRGTRERRGIEGPGNIYTSSQIYFLHRANCCSSRDWASGIGPPAESLAAHQGAGPKPRRPMAATGLA